MKTPKLFVSKTHTAFKRDPKKNLARKNNFSCRKTKFSRSSQLFGLTAGFLTFARLVVPLRVALAFALTPAMDKYVVRGFLKKGEGADAEAEADAEADAEA